MPEKNPDIIRYPKDTLPRVTMTPRHVIMQYGRIVNTIIYRK